MQPKFPFSSLFSPKKGQGHWLGILLFVFIWALPHCAPVVPKGELIAETIQEPASHEATDQNEPISDNTKQREPSGTENTQTKPDASTPDPSHPDLSNPDTSSPKEQPKTPDTAQKPEPVTPDAQPPEPTKEAPPRDTAPPKNVVRVGPKEKLKKPSDAAKIVKDGDVVEIAAGTYLGDVAVWRKKNLMIRGVGGKAHLKANGKSAERKGTWVIKGNNTIVENIEFSGSKVGDRNGAGIRQEGTNLTVRRCHFHDNENGILTGANAQSTVIVEYSVFERNGHGRGQTHNMYIGHIKHFILRYSFTHQAKVGHNVKTRAIRSDILYNRISDEATGTSSYSIDFSNGGLAYTIGNIIQQSPKTNNSSIVSYGAEGLKNSSNEFYFINNTVINNRHTGTFISIKKAPRMVKIINNLFIGKGSFSKNAGWDIRNNLQSATYAGFVNAGAYDYRLKANAKGMNDGIAPGKGGSVSLQPIYQYKHTANREARKVKGKIAQGAYEEP